MKLNGLIYLAVAVLVIMAGVVGWKTGRATAPQTVITAEMLNLAQDSVRIVKANLRDAEDMVASLRASGEVWGHSAKVSAATIADLSAKLAQVQGGGAAVRDTGGWAAYQDRYLTAFFRMDPDTINYSLAVRPIKVSLVEDLNNTWSAWAWDVLDDVPVPIDSLAIQRNKDFSPAKPWYKKLGTIAKYTGVAVVAGSAGYLAGKVF